MITKTCPWCDVQPRPTFGQHGYYDSRCHYLGLICPECGIEKRTNLTNAETGQIGRRALELRQEAKAAGVEDPHFYMCELKAAAEIAWMRIATIWNTRKA